jgi:hypothetical protein
MRRRTMRVPWLLHRSILADLLRTTLLTSSVLVVVVAFGAAVRPLSQNLLGPADLPKFLIYASVPMLQYALPVAAAFSAVTVYHRMSIDREVQAMEAAGLRLRTILAPAVLLGLALMVGMIGLVHWASPIFWRSMQTLLARDAARMLVAAVEAGEGLQVGNLEIYADAAYMSPDPPPSGARDRLILSGVAALEMEGRPQRPRTEFTAENAVIDVYPADAGAVLKLVLVNATVQRAEEQAVAVLPQARPEAIDLGRDLGGEPKGLTLPELIDARRRPAAYRPVQEAARPLERSLMRIDRWRCLREGLASAEGLELRSPLTGRSVVIGGARLVGDRLVPSRRDGAVRLEERADGVERRRTRVPEATLAFESGSDRLELAVAAGTPAEELIGLDRRRGRWPATVGGLSADLCPDRAPPTSLDELLESGRAEAEASRSSADASIVSLGLAVASGVDRLEAGAERFRLDVLARQNQRAAQSLIGLLLPVLGALLGVRSKASVALGAFAMLFIPGILDMLLISSGQQMIRWDRPVPGLLTIWMAQAGMLAIVFTVAWWRVARR